MEPHRKASDAGDEPSSRIGEESLQEQSSARKDLISAAAIAVVAVVGTVLALRLPNPGSVASHPGVLPLLVGVSLLAMALGLAYTAMRAGALRDLRAVSARDAVRYVDDAETRRTLLLIVIVLVYVLLLGWISFDLRYGAGPLVLRISSFECVSIPIIALILRLYWRAPLLRCCAVSIVAIVALAIVFRHGFKILLPGSG